MSMSYKIEDTVKIYINSINLSHNISKIKNYAPNSKILAVVKSNAYGHGFKYIKNIVDIVDAFGVGNIYEAVKLRDLGYTVPIVVMQGFYCHKEYMASINYNLINVIHNVEQLKIINSSNIKDQNFWLKVNTGMRLGFELPWLKNNIEYVKKCISGNNIDVLMTHLHSASNIDKNFSLKQINAFDNIQKILGIQKRSICNSAGIVNFNNYSYEWIRPGLMIYGISPFEHITGHMLGIKPVMNLYSKIISINTCKKGSSIGYDATFIFTRTTIVGIVGIGYSHGYPQVPYGTEVMIKGAKVKVIGKVSMGMLAVDLTDIANVLVGDEVELWGEKMSIEILSKKANISPFELLTRVGNMVN